MPHQSFLWNRLLSESTEIPETIPMQTMEDLILSKDFKSETLAMLRKPCRGDEISVRQPIILKAAEDPEFRSLLEKIHGELRELIRLFGFFDRSEMEEERILLFLPVMKRYFRLTETMTGLEKYGGVRASAPPAPCPAPI